MPSILAHLGPKGSFSEEAAYKFLKEASYNFEASASGILLPRDSFPQVLDATRNCQANYGIVPTENIHGGKVDVMYSLIPELYSEEKGKSLFVVGEEYLQINQSILTKQEMDFKKIKTVISHNQGALQCSDLIQKYNWKVITVSSTSAAAKYVAENKKQNIAAIASPRAAELNGLKILQEDASNIEYDGHQQRIKNVTRFAMLATELAKFGPDEPATTLLEFDVEQNRPGDLRNVLNCLEQVDIMTMHTFNEYFRMKKIICEVNGNANGKAIQQAILRADDEYDKKVRVLGCYATRDHKLTA